MHEQLVQDFAHTFSSGFNTMVGDTLPAKDSYILSWVRNQMLVWAYMSLWMVTFPTFTAAHFFFNDGQIFITFWNTMFAIQPFV